MIYRTKAAGDGSACRNPSETVKLKNACIAAFMCITAMCNTTFNAKWKSCRATEYFCRATKMLTYLVFFTCRATYHVKIIFSNISYYTSRMFYER